MQHLLLDPDLLRLHLGDLPISSKSQLLCRKCRESDILTQSVNIVSMMGQTSVVSVLDNWAHLFHLKVNSLKSRIEDFGGLTIRRGSRAKIFRFYLRRD